jgi:uncharacterized protein YsxB (DUF464 family)
MEDKLQQFFSDNEFDFQEPHSFHLDRFNHKLKHPKKESQTSWKLLSVAASVLLIFGFYLGSNQKQLDLADISPKMEEVQSYFVSAIHHELQTIESNRNLDTESIIESALEGLETLEDNYKNFVKELNKNDQHARIISAMIKNYQRRLDILENTLKQIEHIKNPNLLNDEIYI